MSERLTYYCEIIEVTSGKYCQQSYWEDECLLMGVERVLACKEKSSENAEVAFSVCCSTFFIIFNRNKKGKGFAGRAHRRKRISVAMVTEGEMCNLHHCVSPLGGNLHC